MSSETIQAEVRALCEAAHWCASRGWVPATSGNFSVRDAQNRRIFISKSGLDKGRMTTADLLELDMDGGVVSGAGKPSAETILHVILYRERIEANAILHVHSVWNTLLSQKLAEKGAVTLTGYELLKALEGVGTHDYEEVVPILPNTQNYSELSVQMEVCLSANPLIHGVLLSGHGLYTWGRTVEDARRHLEALEFLFEVEGRRLFGS